MQLPNYLPSSPEQKTFEPNDHALKDKIVLISGATGGMGTELSKRCAQAGATVVLASRNMKKLEKLHDVISDFATNEPVIVELKQDKAGPNEYAELAQLLKTEIGGLDALVHCSAELGTPTHQINIDHSEWSRVMNVNLTAARLLSLHCMAILSINGYDPGPIRTPMRRRAFPGELEDESPSPQTRLGPLLSLITRADRKITGSAIAY